MSLDTHIKLQPKQTELLRIVEKSPATWIGYGGSRGGSKSHGARAFMLSRRLEYKGTRGLIFRRTYEQLWENHIQPLFDQYPYMRDWYHNQHRELTLPGGSVIVFGYAEHPGDLQGFFQGKQYMDIAIDEATHLTEAELLFLKTVNRWPGVSPSQCKMLLTMNPGGVGHAFIKRVFLDRQYNGNESADDYVFLQARAWDNVEWARAALAAENLSQDDYYSWSDEQRFRFFLEKTDYGRTLNRLPQAMCIGHLLGSWDRFAGQYFDFDPAKHVHDARSFELKPWMPRWIGIDWGFAHPTVVEWACQDGKITKQYREYKAQGIGPRAIANEIVDRSRGEKIDAVYLSPDAFAHRTSESSIAEQIGEVLAANRLPRPVEADNDRVGGWMRMYEMLKAGEWQIGDTCQALIETLPMLTRDEKKPEDGIKFEGDDALDATRYLIYSRHRGRQAPRDERIDDRITATDPTSIMIVRRRFARQEERKSAPVYFGRRTNRRHPKRSGELW